MWGFGGVGACWKSSGIKRAACGSALPGDTGCLVAALGQQRIIEGGQQGCRGRQLLEQPATDHAEQILGVDPRGGEEPIDGRPIVEAPPGGVQQAGDGMAAEADQGAQHQGVDFFLDPALAAAPECLAGEDLELVEEPWSGVFFNAEGRGWRRFSTRWERSSTSHSTVSPRENSRAWANAEGKLTYHCWLALRLISWTLVG